MTTLPWKTEARAKAPVAKTTRERILERVVVLFNKHGLQNVTIADIAADLKISPGNLTYHFKRKQDLIDAAIDVLHQRMHMVLLRTTTVTTAEEGAEALLELLRTFWEFRFYFNSLTFLLTKDERLRKDYYAFREWAVDLSENNFVRMHKLGYCRSVAPPNSYRLIAANMWSLQLDWLRSQQIINPAAKTPDLYECALSQWSLGEPYMEAGFSHELIKACEKLLAGDPVPEKRQRRKDQARAQT